LTDHVISGIDRVAIPETEDAMPLTAAVHARGRFVALCDHCRSPIPFEFHAGDVASARAQLGAAGWLECALKGRVRERWAWRCPACVPAKPTGAMRTTPSSS
jgi:hypothetical protein